MKKLFKKVMEKRKAENGEDLRIRSFLRFNKQRGHSMIEMLAVLAIIGVLSISALFGFVYAMSKHRANSIYNDVHLLALHVMDTGKDTVPADFYPNYGLIYGIDTTTYADGFVVTVSDITENVCERIMDIKDPAIERIYVGSEKTTTCSGTQMMGFMFLYDWAFESNDGTSGSGSGTKPVDPCESIIPSTDCSITKDETDANGCVTVQKITCTGNTYCSANTCETCPVPETCDDESCCNLTGPEDVCGRPTKELGSITEVTHSDLNANGCCETTTQESCSLNPVAPRTCAQTCDGICQSGTCKVAATCEANTYISGSDCLSCASGAVSDGTTATCTCDTANGFTGTWVAPADGSDENGCAQGSTCTSNANCKSGYFCAFEDTDDGSNAGKGECQLVSKYGPDTTTVAGFIRSSGNMTWWSAQNWCLAQKRPPAERKTVGCSGITSAASCTSDTVSSFLSSSWTSGVWLEDCGDNSDAYYMSFSTFMGYANVNFTSRAVNRLGYRALCY